jgi:hypothetical protein
MYVIVSQQVETGVFYWQAPDPIFDITSITREACMHNV